MEEKAKKEQEEIERSDIEENDDSSSTRSPHRRSLSPFYKISSATRSPRKSLRKLRDSLHSLSGRKLVDPSEIVSPLLKRDSIGRTPLHLATINKAPEPLLLQLLQAERLAASLSDKSGQLPLHFAVQSNQHEHVIHRIIKAFPNALKTKDLQGRTPVGFAVELIRQGKNELFPENPEDRFNWAPPKSKEEKSWQFEQEKIWSKVDYFLKHFMKQNKCLIPSEHVLILEALEGGAPPKTINRFISTEDKYLFADDDLAGSAISICVERQYCLDTLHNQ